MRSQEDLLKRIEERKDADLFGFELNQYVVHLKFDNAEPFLKDGVKREEWTENDCSPAEHLEVMKEYMPFAFEKVYNERGISAMRSLMHMIAWLWLAEEDKMCSWLDEKFANDYHSYGLPILIHLCKHYGWEIPDA